MEKFKSILNMYLVPLVFLMTLALWGCESSISSLNKNDGASLNPVESAKPVNPGESTDVAGNNLSFPVIWSDGVAKALRGSTDELKLEGTLFTADGDQWYVQNDLNNEWQADNILIDPDTDPEVVVSAIDWGDNLEAKSWPYGSQVRVETVLMKTLENPLTAYTMYQQDPSISGPTEVWGTNGETYTTNEATVYSGTAKLVIQKLAKDRDDPTIDLTWDPNLSRWTGDVGAPDFEGGVWNATDGPAGYSSEVNVQGKVLYGYNWITSKTGSGAGDYRITFVLDPNSPVKHNTDFDGITAIVNPDEGEVTVEEEPEADGGTAYVEAINNLTYIDVRLMLTNGGNKPGGGGGNGNGGGVGGGSPDRPDGSKGIGKGNGNGGGTGGGGKKGDLYGDMYVILRDVNGVPVLSPSGCLQPVDEYGVALPLDEECHPLDEDAAIEVDLGRANVVRSPSKTIDRGLEEVMSFLVQADTIKTDAAGRMVINIGGVDKTTDAPIENLALYRELINKGSLPVTLKSSVVIEDGLEVMFDGDMAPDAADLLAAKSFFAGATDKAVPVTMDKIIYSHVILDLDGTIVQNGTKYVSFTELGFTYNREAAYGNKYADILVEVAPGYYERQTVNVFNYIFGGVTYTETGGAAVYTQAVDDARLVVNFVHEYQVPVY